jgi:3-deoxy-manno-octulosonate cytidylyltransferase (CMP-KDO synthetase)
MTKRDTQGVLAVIPSRYGSTRFPGKPLALIHGKPLLQHVIQGLNKSKLVTRILVATDDERIHYMAKRCGVEAVMTSTDIASGTDRVWAAAKNFSEPLILNVQGDEPLTEGPVVDSLVQAMLQDSSLEMGTLAHDISEEELLSPNSVKVVLNQKSEGIYFSRFAIPYSRQQKRSGDLDLRGPAGLALKHVGLYAFRRNFLQKFCESAPAGIEQAESLEQLRALWMGARIKVIKTEYRSWGVDVPSDILQIEQLMIQRGNF